MNFPIYCINLIHRKDRKEHTKNEFTKLNIDPKKVIYPHFEKDKRGGIFGCFDSHMKIWNDFYMKYPNNNYCLVFEDDFVTDVNSKSLLEKSIDFLDKNLNEIDILNLHNIGIISEHKINNDEFTNGFGGFTHAYFITHHHVESIIHKYGKLPQADGKDIDTIMNFDTSHKLYTNKIFFTNKDRINQLDEEKGKSDIIDSTIIDKLVRNGNICDNMFKITKTVSFIKKQKFITVNDDETKQLINTIINLTKSIK
jgi:hypothetical protein